MIAQAASRAGGLSLDANAKGFFALGNALLDASIATWNVKVVHDTVRPITYIRWLYKGRQIKAWGGPGTKTATIDGANWVPYQEPTWSPRRSGSTPRATAPSPGPPSGCSTCSPAPTTSRCPSRSPSSRAARRFEPGLVPAKNLTLTFKSFSDAAISAGMSRRYGGIHFEPGDLNGRALGAQIGNQAWAKARTYFNGTAS